ncbi:MAG: bifunctional 5,10-methylenetetrahydrofolate dehydrogenase/5,10-methenyltetrahydrofolate cyclohydrolase [Thaumarchaeota archaeon]|nr:bifunctional 5,10-methylenetetrahydrofolate dehydrogenase/5,10-methenyltetrahydrofolate cyclohydrolase [Nitrososphaerota archaeon]
MVRILDGRKIAEEIQGELRQKVEDLKSKGITPKLATILVGEDPAALSYLRRIQKSFETIGIEVEVFKLPGDITEENLKRKIVEINRDSKIHGILLQMPLPKHIDVTEISKTIDPNKDIDCINPMNMGLFLLGSPRFIPCTPSAVYEILKRSGYELKGKEVVVVGGAGRVGRLITLLLIRNGATVTACDIFTRDLAKHTRKAEILVSAVGKPRLITADMVGEGAVVIDVGVSRVEDPERPGKFKIVGDVDFDAVKEKVDAITPVPGGVGPVTTAMLISNMVKATEMLEKVYD